MARNIRNDITKERGSQATTPPTPPVQAEEQKLEVPAPIISPEQKAQEQDRMKQETDAMTADKGAQQASLDYGQMAQILDDNVRESRDAMAEEKARKRKRLFNAIGDGLGALTNLYFTTQGAPSVEYDPRGILTARQQERWDAIDANRNALAQQEYQRKQNELAMRLAEQRQLRQEAISARQRAEDRQWQKEQADRQQEQFEATLANQRAIQEMKSQNQLEKVKETQAGMNYRAGVKGGGGGSMSGKPILAASGETIYVPNTYLDDRDIIAEMYEALPTHLKEQAFEDYNLGKYDAKKQLSNAQMNDIVSRYRSHPDAVGVEKILRRLAGQASGSKKSAGRFSKKDNKDIIGNLE
jgi:hypothetical protein